MFLCDNCHDAAAHIDLYRSRGPCEGCGLVANCIDCHIAGCWKRGPRLPQQGPYEGPNGPKKRPKAQ